MRCRYHFGGTEIVHGTSATVATRVLDGSFAESGVGFGHTPLKNHSENKAGQNIHCLRWRYAGLQGCTFLGLWNGELKLRDRPIYEPVPSRCQYDIFEAVDFPIGQDARHDRLS